MKVEAYTLPVYKTEDYTIFKKLDGNRELNELQVKRLVRAIEKDPEFTKVNPIKLNEKMEIIDGQHRVAAYSHFSKAGRGTHPVYFTVIEGLTLNTARRMNAGSKAWTPTDYAAAYAHDGNENYKIYLEMLKKHNLSHQITMAALTGSTGHTKGAAFKDGLFVVKDKKNAEEVLKKIAITKELFPRGWLKDSFGISMMQFLRNNRYNHDRMITQLHKYSEGLDNVPNRAKEMKAGLNMVYNWARKDKVDLLTN